MTRSTATGRNQSALQPGRVRQAPQVQGSHLDDFKRDLRRSITVEKVPEQGSHVENQYHDSDITSYYNQHKAEFNLIEPRITWRRSWSQLNLTLS